MSKSIAILFFLGLLGVVVLAAIWLWRHRHGIAEGPRDAALTLLGQPTPSDRAHAEWLRTPEGQAHAAAAIARRAAEIEAEEREKARQRIRRDTSGPIA